MPLKFYLPFTPSLREKSNIPFSNLYKNSLDNVSNSHLLKPLAKRAGRNARGCITVRGRGGGHKRQYRIIDFYKYPIVRRMFKVKDNKTDYNICWYSQKTNYEATIPDKYEVISLEYDPNRTARIALLRLITCRVVFSRSHNRNKEILNSDLFLRSCYFKRRFSYIKKSKYILAPKGLKIGMNLFFGPGSRPTLGNSMPLSFLPLGSIIHNLELNLGKGGQIARSAGTFCKLMAKGEKFALVRLPSKEIRYVDIGCYATIGQVGNISSSRITLGKAGRSRWLGRRPKVRGSAKNPVDHSHGGGEGRSPIGLPGPLTPWGKPTLGFKTRKKNALSNKFIFKPRPKNKNKKRK